MGGGGGGESVLMGFSQGGYKKLELCFVESNVDVFLSGFFLESFLEGRRISEQGYTYCVFVYQRVRMDQFCQRVRVDEFCQRDPVGLSCFIREKGWMSYIREYIQ